MWDSEHLYQLSIPAIFSSAGRVLGVAPSSVSRQINELEDKLAEELFHRTTRKLSRPKPGWFFKGGESREILTC